MKTVNISNTGYVVSKNGFGALPVQRVTVPEAVYLLQKAFDNGITFFDTARGYTDSEHKIGEAFGGSVFKKSREKIVIATKSGAQNGKEMSSDLERSLRDLKTDYIDIYQFHNPAFLPKPGGADGLYDAAMRARENGKIRFISLTNHRKHLASEAVDSGLYETLQYPFSYLSSDEEIGIIRKAESRGMTIIAMKALSGGLITNSRAAFAWLAEFSNVLPIWGIQREKELDEFLSYHLAAPELDNEIRALIERDKVQLGGTFCRGCGYCMPCPGGFDIPTMARISLLIRRAPTQNFFTDEFALRMERIETDCIHCGNCTSKCPYGLDTPALLAANLSDYRSVRKK